MVAASSAEAIGNANRYTTCDEGMCLKYVRTWLEIGSGASDATGAWNAARDKHPGDRTPPPGAPCYYGGGSHGHIVLSVSSTHVRSTDRPSDGHVSTVPLAECERAYGMPYLGWSGDLNGVTIPYLTAEGEDMPLTEAEYDRITRNVWTGAGEQPAGSAAYAQTMVAQQFAQVDATLATIVEKLDALAAKLP